MTSLAIGHEAVTSRTETPVASWCVRALVLTGVPHFTLVDVFLMSCTHKNSHRGIHRTSVFQTPLQILRQ